MFVYLDIPVIINYRSKINGNLGISSLISWMQPIKKCQCLHKFQCLRKWNGTWHAPLQAGAKQPVHWFLGVKGLGIQQVTSVWVDSPKSSTPYANVSAHFQLQSTIDDLVSTILNVNVSSRELRRPSLIWLFSVVLTKRPKVLHNYYKL